MKQQVYFSNKGAPILCFALLTGFALSTVAQSTDESEAGAQDAAATSQDANQQKVSTQETVKPVSAASETTTSTKAPRIKAQSAKSADNYEASEEISEDLSVSYPVDI